MKYFLERSPNDNFVEIYSNSNVMEYSLLSNNKPLHPFFRCKDFYNDFIYSLHTKIYFTIHRVNTEKYVKDKDFLLKRKNLKLALRYRDNTKKIVNNFKSISILEKIINRFLKKYSLPVIKLYDEKEEGIILKFSTDYLKYAPFFSLMTTFVRDVLKASLRYDENVIQSWIYTPYKNLLNIIFNNKSDKYRTQLLNLDSHFYKNYKDYIPKNQTSQYQIHNGGFERAFILNEDNIDNNKNFKDMVDIVFKN